MPIPRVQTSGRKKVGARDPQMAPKWPPNRLGVTPKTHAEVHEHKLITIRLSVPSIGNGEGEKAAGNRDSAHLKTCCSLPTRIGAALHVTVGINGCSFKKTVVREGCVERGLHVPASYGSRASTQSRTTVQRLS